jgi:peptidoglycan/LPS O-acetylase OafA/YrhL
MMPYPVIPIAAATTGTYILATLAAGLIAQRGFPLTPQKHRLGCIDGMRGYLALSVLMHHFIVWMQVTRLGGAWDYLTINILNELGAGSVALFFMTTGFVFYPRVLLGFSGNSWVATYASRIFRIEPLVIVSVVIITIIIAIRTRRLPGNDYPLAAAKWITTWKEVTLLSYPDSGRLNAYVLWSLWYEWMFYLFILPGCAIVINLIRGRSPTWIVPLTLGIGSIALRLLGVHGLILLFLPAFGIGMLGFELQRREWIASALRSPYVSVIAAASLVIGMTSAQMPYAYALPLFGFFFLCVACGNSMGGLLRTEGSLVLGDCSFGIYLLHGIFLNLLFVDAARYITALPTYSIPYLMPLAAITVLIFAGIAHVLVERPAITLGAVLTKSRRHRRQSREAPNLEIAP